MAISFNSGTYTGNGVSDTEIVVGFQPNVVFVRKVNVGDNLDCRTSTMAANTSKDITGVNTIRTDRIRNFTANGFKVGTQNAVNANLSTYNWVAFTTDDVNVHVFTYTGDGTDDRSVGSFAFQAGAAMVFSMAAAECWIATDAMPAGECFALDTTGGPLTDQIQALGNGSIQVGATANVNLRVYNVIVWKTANRYMKAITYEGDGNDSRNIAHTLGAQPWFSMIKRSTTSDGIWRMQVDAGDVSFAGEATVTAANLIQAMGVTNTQVGTDGRVNSASGETTYYLTSFGDGTGGAAGPPGGGGRPGRPRPPGGGPPPGGGGTLTGPVLKKLRFPEKVI